MSRRPLGIDARRAGRAGGKRPRQRRLRLRRLAIPLLIALAALASLAAGGGCLSHHLRDATPRPYRASCGLVLLALGLVQLWLAALAYRRSETLESRSIRSRSTFWQWLLAGPVVCYAAALLLGPDPNLRYLYRAALAAWCTLLLLRLVLRPLGGPAPSAGWRARAARRLGHAAFGLAVLAAGAELSLRLYAAATYDALEVTYAVRRQAPAPGQTWRGRLVNAQGYWDDEFQPAAAPGVLRVAVLGDEMTLSGEADTNCLAQIERQAPGVEVYNFGIANTGPREYAALLAQDVLRYRPDVVLTFVSLGNDVTERLPLPDNFAWEGLRLYQLGARWCGALPHRRAEAPPTAQDREAYLREAARGLAVCRTPLADRMRRRWNETFAHLGGILELCRRHEIAAALVLVPAEHQSDAQLRQTLARRCGNPSLDVELPQRRLRVWGREQGVEVLDLLPHLRAARQAVHQRNAREWNEAGNRVAAEVIGHWLRARYGKGATQVAQASTR